MDDFCLLDLEEQRWIKTYVVNEQAKGKTIESGKDLYGHSTINLDSDDASSEKDYSKAQIGHRRGHSLATVYSE